MADMKCIVHDCKNHFSEGAGRIFFLTDHNGALLARFMCNPCYYALIEPQNQSTEHSQVYRNMQPIAKVVRVNTTFRDVYNLRDDIRLILTDKKLTSKKRYDMIFSDAISGKIFKLTSLPDYSDSDLSFEFDIQAFVNAVDRWLAKNMKVCDKCKTKCELRRISLNTHWYCHVCDMATNITDM